MSKSSAKKSAADARAAALAAKASAELVERLGPWRKVVRSLPAKGRDTARVLILACDHRRIGTLRLGVHCGRCK
jgi:hypothetical protein